MTMAVAPAHFVNNRFGADIRALGADDVKVTGPNELVATYRNNEAHANASWALRDTVLGTRLVLDNKSATRDMPQPSLDGVRNLLMQHPGVNGTGIGEGGSLVVMTVEPTTAQRLADLVRPTLPDGTGVRFQPVGTIRPQATGA